ncbi:D-serine ammonia-lyase, partial [Vibrio parahaemolyticus]|uniref:D-serine ammonia-lyase n=3 Tax=Vibrionaceae TaxID=641 RepID=UPI00146CA824
MTKANIEALTKQFPLLAALIDLEEVCWFNPHITSLEEGLPHVGLGEQDIQVASERLTRFAPYLMKAFPETETSRGIIESPVVDIPNMKVRLEQQYDTPILGHLMLKKDSHLPISGSIKARGGIYEVLTHAEKLAFEAGLLCENDDYRKLFSNEFRQFFKQYSIAVGSTGNLGMSIGIMSAKLGFSVSVHMSADAREWKKNKLRSHGVNVVEHQED